MIFQRSSTKADTRFSLFGTGRFLMCKARSNWAYFLLYSCVALLIPMLMLVVMTDASPSERSDLMLEFVHDGSAQVAFAFAAVIAALFSSVFAWKNSHSKVSSYFEHKLPITRSARFLSNTIFGLLIFAIPFILMILIFGIIGAFTCETGLFGDFAASLSKLAAYTLVFYILYYSIFTFSAVVCGSNIVHVVFSVVLLFIPYLLGYCLKQTYESIASWNIAYSPLLEIISISPFSLYNKFGILSEITTGTMLLRSLYVIIAAVVMLAISAVLTIYLKSERAGTPFTYNGVRVVVKYSIIFIVMSLMSLLFESSIGMNSLFGMIIAVLFIILIGFICNLVLNMAMYNSVRRDVLRGIRAFAGIAFLCTVLMCAMIVRSWDAAPARLSPSSCSEVIIFDTTNESAPGCLITDKEDIGRLMDIISKKRPELVTLEEGVKDPVETAENAERFRADIIVNTVFGSTLECYFNGDGPSEEDTQFLKKLISENDTKKTLVFLSENYEVDVYSQGFMSKSFQSNEFGKIFREIYLPELEELYGLDLRADRGDTADGEAHPVYSYFRISVVCGWIRPASLPIYSDMTKTIAAINTLFGGKAFPNAPAFSSEALAAVELNEATINLTIYKENNAESTYHRDISMSLSYQLASQRATAVALMEYITERNIFDKPFSAIYKTAEDEKAQRDPIADVECTIQAWIDSNAYTRRGYSSYIHFNREVAEILGIDYEEIVADVLKSTSGKENAAGND